MAKPHITPTDLAYKIGFSFGLDPYSLSAYHDLASIELPGCDDNKRAHKVVTRFFSGYEAAQRLSREVGRRRVEYVFESIDHEKLFRK